MFLVLSTAACENTLQIGLPSSVRVHKVVVVVVVVGNLVPRVLSRSRERTLGTRLAAAILNVLRTLVRLVTVLRIRMRSESRRQIPSQQAATFPTGFFAAIFGVTL